VYDKAISPYIFLALANIPKTFSAIQILQNVSKLKIIYCFQNFKNFIISIFHKNKELWSLSVEQF
jgi:hypothetical protein